MLPRGEGASPPEVLPPRVDLLGVPLSRTSYEELLALIDRPPRGSRARTVAFCNVHSVMTARKDPALARVLRELDVTTTDGVPLVWALQRLGAPEQQRVYGPDLMELALDHSAGRPWRHYLYGAAPETLQRLVTAFGRRWPDAQLVGHHSPPYRRLTAEEEAADVATIRRSGATHVWVGLGMPKQERFIHRVADRLPGTTLLAVGAAFDMHAGVVSQAPDWIQGAGMEWLYRWVQEPRRLTSRYLVNNPLFVILAAAQVLRSQRRPPPDDVGWGRP